MPGWPGYLSCRVSIFVLFLVAQSVRLVAHINFIAAQLFGLADQRRCLDAHVICLNAQINRLGVWQTGRLKAQSTPVKTQTVSLDACPD